MTQSECAGNSSLFSECDFGHGYQLSTQDINAALGANLARYTPVGDTWEFAGFPLNFYADDIYHAQNRGTLLNALVLYQTIYDDPTTSDIPLSGLLANVGLSAQDGVLLTSLADAMRIPEPASLDIASIAMFTLAVRRRRIACRGGRYSRSFAAHRFFVTVSAIRRMIDEKTSSWGVL